MILSSLALAGLVAGGVAVGTLPAPGRGLRVLSDDEAAWATAIAGALFPSGSALGVAGRDVDVARRLDDLLADVWEGEAVLGVRWVLRALEFGTVPRRGGAFSSLSVAEQREVLATWHDNEVLPRRLLHDLLRTAFGIAFFNAPEVRSAVGWRARCGDPDAPPVSP
jgi:hypothetical protein